MLPKNTANSLTEIISSINLVNPTYSEDSIEMIFIHLCCIKVNILHDCDYSICMAWFIFT